MIMSEACPEWWPLSLCPLVSDRAELISNFNKSLKQMKLKLKSDAALLLHKSPETNRGVRLL